MSKVSDYDCSMSY